METKKSKTKKMKLQINFVSSELLLQMGMEAYQAVTKG